MEVLRAFRSDRAPVTNAELVRRTGFSKASVSRFTATLAQLDFVRQVPGGRAFEIGTGPLGIGQAFLACSELSRVAEPVLQDLAERLGVSAALALPDQLDMIYVAYRASERVVALRMGVGWVFPMAVTAVGHACLWAQHLVERDRLMEQLRRQAGAQGDALMKCIDASFAQLDRSGACGTLSTFQRDAYAIATPIRVGRQQVLMGLSCGRAGTRPDLSAETARITPHLHEAARTLQILLADK